MRRPPGVVVAAVILGLIALFGIFGEVLILGITIFVHAPVIPSLPAARATLLVTNTAVLCFFLFCEWTVAGLFRMRRWARVAVLIIGGLMFCISAVLCVGMTLVHVPPLPVTRGPSPVSLHTVFLAMATFYGLLSLVGAWWLVYFNLGPVRAAFRAADPRLRAGETVGPGSATPASRMVIVVWACLMLAGSLFFPWALWMHLPVFLFGGVLRGAAAAGTLAGLLIVQVFLGIGLLQKWKAAWYVGLASLAYWVAHALSFLLPGAWARFGAYQRELAARWGAGAHFGHTALAMNQRPLMAMGLGMGTAIVLVLAWALVRRRGDYVGRASVAV